MQSEIVNERVLVVDDQATHRRKLKKAVETLGYEAISADNGKNALLQLRKSSFDLVLLDILMPEIDGFAVMEFMQREPAMRDIPVIVVSALDSDMDSVVRAIEFGAHDFLPKNFDPVLLRTRINTSLASKRNRDQELEHLRQVDRLTDAAVMLENSNVDPSVLRINDVCARDDALGQLARVFADMAKQVHDRDQQLFQQIRTLRAIGLLVAIGCIIGLSIPVTRIAALQSQNPFGIALWVNVFCAVICLSIAVYRGSVPKLTKGTSLLFLAWGLIGTLLGEVTLIKVAAYLNGSLIAIIVVAEVFLVFAVSAIMGNEKIKIREITGFLIGLLGLLSVVFTIHAMQGTSGILWAMLALAVPLSYGFRTLLLTLKLPSEMDLYGAVGFSAVAGAIIVLPFVLLVDDFVSLTIGDVHSTNVLLFAILLLAIITATGTALRATLIKTTGAVFSSLSSLVTTVAGVAWSMLLLSERLPPTGWIALLLMLAGVYLVSPGKVPERAGSLTHEDHEL